MINSGFNWHLVKSQKLSFNYFILKNSFYYLKFLKILIELFQIYFFLSKQIQEIQDSMQQVLAYS